MVKLKSVTMLAALLFFMVVFGIAIWVYSQHTFQNAPIASIGGESLELSVKESNDYFLQTDPRWSNDAIGGSGELLSSVGCTISAVAMASVSLGYSIDPGELNKRLINIDGYTKRGWLIWEKIEEATFGEISVRVPSDLQYQEIDQALMEGSIPIVKYYLPNGISHWVVIVGKSGREYLTKDSLDSNKQITALSKKTEKVVSVRYVKKQ
jgi:hypothetical protein